MSVLVTGGTGALGYHLLSMLTKTKGKLHSFSDEPPFPWQVWKHVEYYSGNLLNYKEILEVLQKTKPKEVYHLASQSSVGLSYTRPYETLSTNILGTQNLLEAIRQTVPKTKVLLVSSAEVYGRGTLGYLGDKFTEDTPPNPITPYATSKASMELLGNQYAHAYDMHIVTVRPFHFTGPNHSRRFALASMAYQLIQIKQNRGEPVLFTGNLDITRDVVDVRDLARAMVMVMNSSEPTETYNVCGGNSYTLRGMLELLFQFSGIYAETRVDPNLERSNDIPILIGSPQKIMDAFSWKPMIGVEDSLEDLYNEMQQRIRQETKKR
ncbi:MAG: NAD-dependent epimerase/dehydratase family protein [Fibrobacter sp.]|nr:NAD-dependent epimerase/dehydratase family protein [Fibrobacter sp.]